MQEVRGRLSRIWHGHCIGAEVIPGPAALHAGRSTGHMGRRTDVGREKGRKEKENGSRAAV